ncbi:MAG: SGNH/GDSL hydrolase family protein [Bacteroides sp.]|uniref:SGNH/GDSL hydrolase family protein n=1 Tax=Bacteroides sp. TaxID=29523 RepID=UPI002FC9117E
MMKFYYLYLFILLGACCFSTVKAKSSGNVFKGNDPAVRYIGRTLVSSDGSVAFDWVGTYLETRFTGGSLSVKVTETGTSYYNVFVDNKLYRVVKVCGIDTLINMVSGIDKGIHRLKIQKRSEGEFGKTTIHQFVLSHSGRLQEEPVRHTRHIEFIGNSITCGYGTDGNDRDDPFLVETENCNLTFAALTARYFDADYTLIAHSGRGAVRNYGDSVRVSQVTMKDRMLNTFDEDLTHKWDFIGYRPSLVVINLGSNDFATEPHPYKSEFITAYKQIISQLRQHYGDIPILCVYPIIQAPVYSYYEAMQAEMNDPKVFLLQLKEDLYNRTTDLGAGWHPGRSGHLKMAMWMIPYISTITGWPLNSKVIE